MYRKLHIEKYLSSQESFSSKGSFFVWVPENPLCELTLYILYSLKTEKTTGSNQLFFLFHEW